MGKTNLITKILLIAMSVSLFHPTIAAQVDKEANDMLSTDAHYQKMILHYINAYRAKQHLPALKLIDKISVEAAKHSRDMASKSIPFGHQYFDTRIAHLYKEIKDCHAGAENVAYYKLDPKRLVDAWVASRGHRRNIEGNYNLTGIGIAHGKKGWAYYTQIFLRTDERKHAA